MKKGVIAGNFDVMHPGYIKMFKEAANNCDCLIVMLHTDPSIERPNKLKPILNVDERIEMLNEIKSICGVHIYTYEAQLLDLLKMGEFDIRFLGDDYKGKPFTGDNLNIPIYYLNRDHGWSTTKFKNLIAKTVK
jgi:glycerol-3-phosphate cytidylyltransferase